MCRFLLLERKLGLCLGIIGLLQVFNFNIYVASQCSLVDGDRGLTIACFMFRVIFDLMDSSLFVEVSFF